ncbi:MAG: Rubredoxin-NAD(+) reductase [Dehalococcoidia bacterium]|nr:Rubredoxin-NAD(+) reductase [Chloroflexota bacterium]
MASPVHGHLREKGVELHLGDGIEAIHHDRKYSTVDLSSGERIETDMIVLGIGVRPEKEMAEDAGLELGERGVHLSYWNRDGFGTRATPRNG